MKQRTKRITQIDHEQSLINAMYERLDYSVQEHISAQQRESALAIDEPADRYAHELEIARHGEAVSRLRAAERSLCFGRIDRASPQESMHIGRIGIRNEADHLLLIDWRAEAARPFYAATIASSMGVRRRRHLRLDGRQIIDATDEILDGSSPTDADLVGDSPLISALTAARTGRMSDAAATLQTEQDDIVRSPHRGVMIVEGGPGTGKTIVALHRAAYVLYAFPSIAGRGVMIFGPNKRFLSYISEVLPSLGENDVRLATMCELVGASATVSEPDHVARIKGRTALALALARRVRQHRPHQVPLNFDVSGETVELDSTVIDAARRHALRGDIGHNPAREIFLEYLADEIASKLRERAAREQSDFENELEELLGIDLDRFTGGRPLDSRYDDPDYAADDLGIDWDRVRDELRSDPELEASVARVWPSLDPDTTVRTLLNDTAALSDALPDVPAADITLLGAADTAGWSNADLALVDEARALIEGPPPNTFGHIVVDEAQQLSEMQWRMLMRRCPNRSMTIVGDLAQAGPSTTVASWDEAMTPHVGNRFTRHRLTVNYRTTAEILGSTETMLAQIAPNQQISTSLRNGQLPQHISVDEGQITQCLLDLISADIQQHPDESIGVITTAPRAPHLRADIQQPEVTVISAADARGLEFDAVAIVDPHGIRISSDAGLRDLYVAHTRATKRLWLVQVSTDPVDR